MQTTQDKKIFSVTQLTRQIKTLLETHFENLWVEGEVSNFKKTISGHSYFTLKDQDSQLKCVLFNGVGRTLKFDIKDGTKVVCFGRISLYEKTGNYQLYVDLVEPKGIGALQLAFEQLKQKLKQEGLFDASKKKPIPKFPEKIGVVTSPTGAAIKDILNIINRRFSNIHIIINPVKVQGELARFEIVSAIEDFNTICPVDVIIVARGGGSLEDLWAFNEEIVARAIFDSKIPIISAVGHEIDWTISDFVSDLRAPTPSAAAELVVGRREDVINFIEQSRLKITVLLNNKLDILKNRVKTLKQSYVLQSPRVLLSGSIQKIDDFLKQIDSRMKEYLSIKKGNFIACVGKLDALNPLAVLKRGYSVTSDVSGRILRSVSEVRKSDRIKTKFIDGEIESIVEV